MDEYREMSQHWVEQAAAFPQLGGVRRGPGVRSRLLGLPHGGEHGEQDAAAYLDLNLRLVRQLLDSKQAWAGRMWYRIPRKSPSCSPPRAAGAPARLGGPQRMLGH